MRSIDAQLVSDLIGEQFPQWRSMTATAVPAQGWDNRTFRLGDELSVRLPSGPAYVAAIDKEQSVLPFLAAQLPLPVPKPVGLGRPGCGYPFPWSVRNWLPGDTLAATTDLDRVILAEDVGRILAALRSLPTAIGPAAGRHSHFRGCRPGVYADQVDTALHHVADEVDGRLCRRIWQAATASAWPGAPVWFHGDVAAGNLLVQNGRLSAVIDFGTCGIGDPACDLVLAWTYFVGAERQAFRHAVGLADDAWHRARGWALWKALATLAGLSSPDPDDQQRHVLREVLADPVV
ncbi:MAG: aminoglycoside phosphotransferase family protein [Jatrophihabitantaceae bacterium]